MTSRARARVTIPCSTLSGLSVWLDLGNRNHWNITFLLDASGLANKYRSCCYSIENKKLSEAKQVLLAALLFLEEELHANELLSRIVLIPRGAVTASTTLITCQSDCSR